MASMRIPDYVEELLSKAGCKIVTAVKKNGGGHPFIKYKTRSGEIRYWGWPLGEHRNCFRAFRNNKAQLRRKLEDEKQ